MAGTEGFAALRVGLLNPHGTVAISDDLFLAALTRFDHELLRPIGCAAGLVAFHLRLIDLRHHATTKSTICPSGVRSLLGSGLYAYR